MSWHLTITL